MKIYHNGYDMFVAKDREHLAKLVSEYNGYENLDLKDLDIDINGVGWEELNFTGSTLTIVNTDDDSKTTLTLKEWVENNGPGFLCSSEF